MKEMYKKNKIKAIVAFVVAVAFFMPASVAFANDERTLTVQPVMSILPSTQTVEKDDLFTVDVYIDPEDYLISGANVDLLSFNQTVIQATSPVAVTFSNFFAPPKLQGYGTVDNVAGTITGIYELTMPFVGVGTEGTWITIEFTAVGTGTSPITMDVVGLPDENGDKIEPITVFNGEVIVVEYFNLTIDVVGHGTTVPAPGVHIYPNDVVVGLEAFPDAGWEFVDWSGDITTTDNPTDITMDSNKSVTATFTQIEYTITTSTNGTGSGTLEVTPVGPYYYNDEVTLWANANAGSMFTGWYEDLTGTTNPETLTITSNIEVTAEFTLIEYTLTINIVGSGYVTKDPEQATYHYGDNVQLNATAEVGWIFSDWSGDLVSTDNPDTITIYDDIIVTATFTQIEYTITTSTNGTGSGTLEVTPAGPYHYNDVVTLWANANAGSVFTGWYEDLTGTTTPETLIINSNIAVTAEFTLIEYTLTINIVGSGYVTKDPEQATYHYGDNVQLYATAEDDLIFSDWSGDLVSTDNPDTITIDGNNTVTATFIHADIYPPVITNVTMTISDPIDTDPVYGWEKVSCTVIDDGVGVDEVKLVLTYPDTSTIEHPMIKDGSTYSYETSLTNVGDYTYHIWADDTIGNIAESTPETFILPPNCEVDMNYGTRIIDFWDLVEVVKFYGDTGSNGWIREDVDNNGVVDFWDLVEVVKYYGDSW